jgi:hypothetical protein
MHLTAARLDRQIAARLPYPPSATLELRMRHLVDPLTRRRLAQSLRGVVEYVAYVERAGQRPLLSAVVIELAPVRSGRAALLGLADRLDGPDTVTARGVVLTRALLTDGANSPLFNPNCTRTVTEAVWEIADALGADDPPVIESHPLAR